jgi:hypothetical protein
MSSGSGSGRSRIFWVLFELLARFSAPTAGSTAGTQFDDEGEKVKSRCNPHKNQHARTKLGMDVKIVRAVREDIFKDDEHDSCNDGGNGCE